VYLLSFQNCTAVVWWIKFCVKRLITSAQQNITSLSELTMKGQYLYLKYRSKPKDLTDTDSYQLPKSSMVWHAHPSDQKTSSWAPSDTTQPCSSSLQLEGHRPQLQPQRTNNKADIDSRLRPWCTIHYKHEAHGEMRTTVPAASSLAAPASLPTEPEGRSGPRPASGHAHQHRNPANHTTPCPSTHSSYPTVGKHDVIHQTGST